MTQQLYAIIDVETTGGSATRDKITEIAIVLHDGERVLDRFETLINPGCNIPYGITELTGITQEMVADAPRFYEVAKAIVEMTEGAIFVAHNVRFDYSFICEEFRRLGYTYTRKQLCTVRLSRKSFPGLRSYSLSFLIKHLDLKVGDRHRAMGDTLATVDLFERIMRHQNGEFLAGDLINLSIRESKLPGNLTLELLHKLPNECGVYYFHDRFGDVVYVGKSKNIQQRVASHFTDKTEKASKLQQLVHDVSFEVTSSELASLLFESHEIKRLQPSINRAQRTRSYPYALFSYHNQAGYLCFEVGKHKGIERRQVEILASYPNQSRSKGKLMLLQSEFNLCRKLCNLEQTNGACFHHHLGKCPGACVGDERVESYNERAEMARKHGEQRFPHENFFIIENGRNSAEQVVVMIENGKYRGWGFVDEQLFNDSLSNLSDAVKPYEDNQEIRNIIARFLEKNKNFRLLLF